MNAGTGAFGRPPAPIRYSSIRCKLVIFSVSYQLLSLLTDVGINYEPIFRVFQSSAMVKMYVFVDWACTFLKDKAMILYILYSGYVRISIVTSKWVAMAVRDR